MRTGCRTARPPTRPRCANSSTWPAARSTWRSLTSRPDRRARAGVVVSLPAPHWLGTPAGLLRSDVGGCPSASGVGGEVLERHLARVAGLLGQAEATFADDVALDLVGAAVDGGRRREHHQLLQPAVGGRVTAPQLSVGAEDATSELPAAEQCLGHRHLGQRSL